MGTLKKHASLRVTLLVAAALALYWIMAVSVSPRMGVTGDEVVHITGGYSYWTLNDYRLHPENGNLAQRIAALPLLGLNLNFPPLTDPDWQNSKVNLVGEKFFYHEGNSVASMLLFSRMMIALVGAFTIWLIWRWARGLFGPKAGWLALGLSMFCPALLAHGGLATSDMVMTACVLSALSIYWKLLHRATWLTLALATLGCGLAILSKMSGVIIVPLIAILLVIRGFRPAPIVLAFGRTRWLRRSAARWFAFLGLTGVTAAGSLLVLWAGFGFRYQGNHPDREPATGYYFSWEIVLSKEPIPTLSDTSLTQLRPAPPLPVPTHLDHLVGWLRDHRLLPEAYLWGFAQTNKFSRARPAYFLGELRNHGWVCFFPIAFLLKTPPSALLLGLVGGLALISIARRKIDPTTQTRLRPWFYRSAPLAIFFVGYWAMALTMNLNIGHRHILPIYPVFYVLAAASVYWIQGAARRTISIALIIIAGLNATDSILARPFYLSYFQSIVGGMEQGYHYLIDSSLDWGQGLPDLDQWLQKKSASGDKSPVYLSYFGADSPRARHLDVIRFGDEVNDRGQRNFPAQLHAGWYAISATHFVQTYAFTRGPWSPDHSRMYAEIQQRLSSPAAHQQALQDCMDLESLQAARLFLYLQKRRPDEFIGGSLLVFQLTESEVHQALYGPIVAP